MRTLFIIHLIVCSVLLSGVVNAQKKKKKRRVPVKPVPVKPTFKSLEFEGVLFDEGLWETKIADFEKNSEHKKFKFEWQSAAKKGLRSEGNGFKLLGVEVGDTLIVSNDGEELKGISISVFNRGDDGSISRVKFEELVSELKSKISAKLAVKSRDEDVKSVVNFTRSIWSAKGATYQLERSVSSKGVEFLRLRAMSAKTAKRGESTANRTSLRVNVVKDRETGDVYIDNIPMIDQGKKGYCACASAARIYQYYGRTTDQHEVAQIAGSSARGGTSISGMVGSLKKVTSRLNSRVNILYEYPKGLSDKDLDYRTYMSGRKEMIRDLNNYQSLAKKNGKKGIVVKGEEYKRLKVEDSVSFLSLAKIDAKTFREVMMDKTAFPRFKNKIKEYVNQGIPVGWCLQLGMFPEPGLPQASGGHMRLIIGYNEKTEKLIYTDSWGDGHGKKSMDAGEAFSMTNVILVLPPTK